MLMEHFLCDDVGGKRNVCGMTLKYFYYLYYPLTKGVKLVVVKLIFYL